MFDATKTQTNLAALGYKLGVDGIAGPATFTALLARAAGRALATPLMGQIAVALVAHLDAAQINTPLRVRMLLSQACCETAGFSTMQELGDAAYFARYDWRRDLGNTQAGDGARFHGRGLLDTTGRANYAQLAQVSGLDCVNNPDLLLEPENAVIAATAFWNFRNLNPVADTGDLRQVTQLINGGLNGLTDRQTFFERLAVLQ